jgi:hypothetical protein
MLVARDRSAQSIDAVTGKGALSKQHLLEHLDRGWSAPCCW